MFEPEWYTIALREAGVCEHPGKASNSRIDAYFEAVSMSNSPIGDEVPWCAAFVGACLTWAGYGHSGSLLARSYCNYGQPSRPRRGAIAVFRRGSITWKGHVAFLDHFLGNYAVVLGGNQNNCVRYAKYPRVNLLDIRWPLGAFSDGNASNDNSNVTPIASAT